MNIERRTTLGLPLRTDLGKCVRMSVLFSGGSLSFSCLACSSSCLRMTVKTERSNVRPKIRVVWWCGRLSQN